MYVGDIQLKALMSFIKNELSREEKVRHYRGEEMTMIFLLRLEAKDPRTYCMDWLNVADTKLGSQKINPLREATYT